MPATSAYSSPHVSAQSMLDFSQLDKKIHEKGRLAIMTLLTTRPDWCFQDLKRELGMSDGNLITHLRSLDTAGYVSMTKESGKRPQTKYALTESGNTSFQSYLQFLEKIVLFAHPKDSTLNNSHCANRGKQPRD